MQSIIGQALRYIRTKITIRTVVIFLFITVLSTIAYWLSTVSFIEVSIADTPTGRYLSYRFYDQGKQKMTEVKTNSTMVRKRVSRGSYEVLVGQEDKSFFTVVKAKGFFQKSSASGSLEGEKGRRFVGDSPESCMYLSENILRSYVCGDTFDSLKLHRPATDVEPTYAVPNTDSPVAAVLEGLAKTPEGSLALVIWPSDGESAPAHFIYQVDADMKTSRETMLTNLSGKKSYGMRAYKEGFIVYSSSLDEVWYYASSAAQPSRIAVEKPKRAALAPASFDVQKEAFVLLFSNNADEKKPLSEVVFVEGGKPQHYEFKTDYSSARLCDTRSICLLGSGSLDIYDITSGKAKFLYAISNVRAIERSSNGVLAIRKNEIINIAVKKRYAFIEYSLGTYTYNSILVDTDGYVLNLTDRLGRKIALQINQAVNINDSIDKKIAELQKLDEITAVSIYGNFIFISPRLGQMIYDPSTDALDFDPAVRKLAGEKINAEVNRLGIDTSIYKIINTSE